ncbi:MAG: helix-turn-helix domain-containing protein [Oscillospiraceae bacterium]|nr:helix-turn-helix domain-containing protein [Oscillospiraceae bacterium]
MYRAYFIDDEPLVLGELTSNPLITQCGYQIVGTSTSPAAAKKEIKKLAPDVVFTDLRMPGCSGVELIRDLKEGGSLCEFVIISAYEDFNALRSFMHMDGFDYLKKPVSCHDLRRLLGLLAGKIAGKRPMSDIAWETPSPQLNMIAEYLSDKLMIKHTLESVSAALEIHPKHISRLFAGKLGTTFVGYLTKLRMEEAARLLKSTNKDIKEIAAFCGFKDYFYFCRVFREYHFCTPTEFREGIDR